MNELKRVAITIVVVLAGGAGLTYACVRGAEESGKTMAEEIQSRKAWCDSNSANFVCRGTALDELHWKSPHCSGPMLDTLIDETNNAAGRFGFRVLTCGHNQATRKLSR
jgi:hypothetical protein